MCHLTSAETDRHLDTIAVAQKLHRVLQLGVEIVVADTRRHANLLHFHDTLILLGFLGAFGLFKPELAVIHDFAYGRFRIGRDLHEIQSLLCCDTVRFLAGYDTQLLTVFPDQSNFFVDDGIIQFMFRLCDLYTPPSSE